MTTQLTVMPAIELRDVLHTALCEVRPIEAKCEEKVKGNEWSQAGIGFVCVGLLVGMFAVALLWDGISGAGIIILLITLGLIALGIMFGMKKRARNLAFKQKTDEEIAQLFQCATIIHSLPTDYWSTVALEYMLGLLDKGRATTWAECADKYEEQVHRWTVEVNTAEAARYAASASRTAKWAAVGAWRR